MAFLNPSNDNRANLLLLLLDEGRARLKPDGDAEAAAVWSSAAPVPFGSFASMFDVTPVADRTGSRFLSGEGSRCVSNDLGTEDFQKALAEARDLPAPERETLAAARKGMSPECSESGRATLAPLESVTSATGRQFAGYLAGAAAFYDGDFDTAGERFAGLAASGQPWLKEAATYMRGRVALNRAQVGAFDKDDGLLRRELVDKASLTGTGTLLEDYLRLYPQGRYATSAQGLMRRVAWLGGDFGRLATEFTRQIDQGTSSSPVDVASEVDNKLFADFDPAASRDVRLLAMWDLVQIRNAIPASANAKPFELARLEAQKASFAGHEDLYAYLLAAHAFYAERQPAKALALLPATKPDGPLKLAAFSSEMLRGLALEAAGNGKDARAHWLGLVARAEPRLQQPVAALALAMSYERSKEAGKVFEPGSPFRDPALRAILLEKAADATILRRIAATADAPVRERTTALWTLLRKELATRRYKAFVEDLALLPETVPEEEYGIPNLAVFKWAGTTGDYRCPGIADVAKALIRNDADVQSLICVGEFLRLNGLEDPEPIPADELGGAPSLFTGKTLSRQGIYQQIIANRKVKPDDRAYALHRAVRCYEPTGKNHCDGAPVPVRERAKWFRTLKAEYPKSRWADISYYW